MGWQQIGTSLAMTAPSNATFLAQSTPWFPAIPESARRNSILHQRH
jgi:hypothetical protein